MRTSVTYAPGTFLSCKGRWVPPLCTSPQSSSCHLCPGQPRERPGLQAVNISWSPRETGTCLQWPDSHWRSKRSTHFPTPGSAPMLGALKSQSGERSQRRRRSLLWVRCFPGKGKSKREGQLAPPRGSLAPTPAFQPGHTCRPCWVLRGSGN